MAARGSRQRQKLLLLHCHSLGEGGDFHKILKILSEMPLANYMFSCHKKLKMRWVSPVTMSERSSTAASQCPGLPKRPELPNIQN